MFKFASQDLTKQLSTGLSSALMTCTGGAILIVQTALLFNFTNQQLIGWFIVCYTLAGLFNLLLAVYYKLPIAGAHSITTIAFLSTSTFALNYNTLIGTYLLAGALIFILGISGIFSRFFHYIPRPVIEAMLAGIVLQFVLKLIPIFNQYTFVALLALIGFLLSITVLKFIPSMVLVLVLSCTGLLMTTAFPATSSLPFSLPVFALPEFSWQSAVSLALPIAILILSNDLAVSLAALKRSHYNIDMNKFISLSGLATVVGSFFGGHSINAGGMMTTLCSSEESGHIKYRYRAGIISSIGCILFGLFAWLIVPYLLLLPQYFITLVVGFSLLGICINSLKLAFSDMQYRYSVVFAFIISTANVSFFNISSALWSLIIGTIMAIIFKEGIYAKKEV